MNTTYGHTGPLPIIKKKGAAALSAILQGGSAQGFLSPSANRTKTIHTLDNSVKKINYFYAESELGP